MEGFTGTESWTSSEAPSSESLSRARSLRFAQQVPNLDSTSTEWTDEKHNLYLKSMEASFVDQLYGSPWKSQKKKFPGSKSSRQTHRTSSGQFKVLRGGCWKKIGFRPNKRDRSSCFMASPWIQHFRSGFKSRVFTSCSHLQDNASPKEVSDQNFVDEEQGENTSNERSSKKLKTLAYDASYYDQAIL